MVRSGRARSACARQASRASRLPWMSVKSAISTGGDYPRPKEPSSAPGRCGKRLGLPCVCMHHAAHLWGIQVNYISRAVFGLASFALVLLAVGMIAQGLYEAAVGFWKPDTEKTALL